MFPTFELFGRDISMYGVVSLIGIFVCAIYICRSAKKRGYDDNDFIVIPSFLGGLGTFKNNCIALDV